jgi:hypothetical protein
MPDDKEQWLTTTDIQKALAGHRDNDIKVQINGCYVPLGEIRYSPQAESWILVPYDGDDLAIALS